MRLNDALERAESIKSTYIHQSRGEHKEPYFDVFFSPQRDWDVVAYRDMWGWNAAYPCPDDERQVIDDFNERFKKVTK